MQTTDRAIVAGDIMTRSLVTTRPDDDLKDAEDLLIEHRVSGLPVVEAGRLVGVLSRSDIARIEVLMKSLDGLVWDRLNWEIQADGFRHTPGPEFEGFRGRLGKLKVRDAMSDQLVTCAPQTPVRELASEMWRRHVHRIIVVEGTKPLGIVSSLDLARLVGERGVGSTD